MIARRPTRHCARRQHPWITVIGLLSLGLAGCGESGPALYPVAGRVTYQGQPVTTGTVMFVPEQGPAATTTIEADGRYSLQAVPGKHRVSVTAQQPLPDDFDPDHVPAGWTPPPALVPEKFNRPSTSGLTAKVTAGQENTIDLTLVE